MNAQRRCRALVATGILCTAFGDPFGIGTIAYDADGNIVSVTADIDFTGNGVADARQASTNTYDSQGRLVGTTSTVDHAWAVRSAARRHLLDVARARPLG